MKKWLLGLMMGLGLLMVGCSSIQKAAIPKNVLNKESKLINVKIERVIDKEVFLSIENKSSDIVEVALSESTINNRPIFDVSEINAVIYQNSIAAMARAANSLNQLNTALYGAFPKPKEDETTKDLTKRSDNIYLAPEERMEKIVGNGFEALSYPAKIVIKAKQNEYSDYAYITLENPGEIVEVDSSNNYRIVSK